MSVFNCKKTLMLVETKTLFFTFASGHFSLKGSPPSSKSNHRYRTCKCAFGRVDTRIKQNQSWSHRTFSQLTARLVLIIFLTFHRNFYEKKLDLTHKIFNFCILRLIPMNWNNKIPCLTSIMSASTTRNKETKTVSNRERQSNNHH